MVRLTKAILICLLQPTVVGTTTVDLNYTAYEGLRLSNGVDAFLGMRYAAPPLGDLRWRAPLEPIRSETGAVERATTVSDLQLYKYDLKNDTDRFLVSPHMPRYRHGLSRRRGERRLSVCQCLGAEQCHRDVQAARVGVYSGRW
jgi:hypothetical protein